LTITKITEKVHMIDTLALGQPNTVAVYVLRGAKTALVDCGYASSSETVLQGLAEMGVSASDVDYIIPTHVHLDHGGGAGHLLRRMPRAKVLAQERGVPHLIDPTRLVDSATRLFGQKAIDSFGLPVGIDPARITAIGEELHLDLGGVSITALHSPGHAPHQLSVFVEGEKLLLTADAVGIVYPAVRTMIPTTPPPSFNPLELWGTTERLQQLGSKALLVPHYGIRSDSDEVLETTRKKTDAWVLRVKEMKKGSLTMEQMSEALKEEVLRESGISEKDFPPYADISIGVTVRGILHYLEKNP
jgi:glyoxylase-like metal-dependent hydrolase (beta-lactamase superfamily II)